MKTKTLSPEAFSFLKTLSKNNNRDWFEKNKETYKAVHSAVVSFADGMLEEMNKHDEIETSSGAKALFRIYRDIRFSKDKTPYKTHWSGSFKRAGKALRGGYYFHLEPGGHSVIAGGFWGPEPADLKRMREAISDDPGDFKKILNASRFKKFFGELEGEKSSQVPRGFDKNDPTAEYLKFKQYLLIRKFSDKEVLSPSFLKESMETYKAMRPFFNFMSDALGTDRNGVSIL